MRAYRQKGEGGGLVKGNLSLSFTFFYLRKKTCVCVLSVWKAYATFFIRLTGCAFAVKKLFAAR